MSIYIILTLICLYEVSNNNGCYLSGIRSPTAPTGVQGPGRFPTAESTAACCATRLPEVQRGAAS